MGWAGNDIGPAWVWHNPGARMQTQRTHFLDNRLPPLLVSLVVAAMMRGTVPIAPALSLPWPGRELVALVLVIVGALVIVAGVASFTRHKTTVNPFKPATASSLVDSGIYGRTRNPMYLGVAMALFGYAAFLSHPLALFAAFLFPAYIGRFQIGPEERALDQVFGEAYEAYKKRVPRWL
jgi:protein-S-isoprenylcysteine O-methyltransferase Ste14